MPTVRLGLLSCGNMGASLARSAQSLPDADVVAVCDIDGEKARALAEELEARSCTDYSELIGADDVDAVIVASPNFLHCLMTIAAAEAKKHVFCEKPMALNVKDCRAMIDACERAGVKLMIGQVLRYLPVFETITELIETGDFGKPFSVTTCRIGGAWGAAAERAPWRNEAKLCGGVLFEVSQHELDYIRCLLGNAKSVYAAMGQFIRTGIDYADLNHVLIQFEDGGIGSLLSGQAAEMGSYDGKVLCEKGSIFFDNSRRLVKYRLADGEAVEIDAGEREFEPGVRKEVRQFCEAILQDEEPAIPGIEGLRNVEIAQAAVLSAEEGRVVELPL
jgi:UDP-N-acetylglucosamine 3-dehydrogenase